MDAIELELPNINAQKYYTGFITGETEYGAFSQIPIHIFVGFASSSESPTTFSLTATPQYLAQHGGIVWNHDENSTGQILGNAEQFRVQYEFDRALPTLNWYTSADSQSSSQAVQAIAETASLNAVIDGDCITGNISARGFYSPTIGDSKTFATAYSATFSGEIVESQLAKHLRCSLEESPFSGRWQSLLTEEEAISLSCKDVKVVGTLINAQESNATSIQGTWEGSELEFSGVFDGQPIKGHLRAVAGGSALVGFWNDIDHTQFQPIAAVWKLPEWLSTAELDQQDAQDLRFLGHELSIQGRTDQAAAILTLSLNYYEQRRNRPDIPAVERTGMLASEAFTLAGFLPNCHFQLGDYDSLIQNLDYMLEVLHLIGPDASASRLFQERSESLRKAFDSNASSLELFRSGYQQTLHELDGPAIKGVVGFGLGREEEGHKLIVTQILPNGSSELAGIQLKDILLSIDGISTKEMNVRQATERLRGSPNSEVICSIKRNNQKISFTLVRQPYKSYPQSKKAHLRSITTALLNIAVDVCDQSLAYKEYSRMLVESIAVSEMDLLSAWAVLQTDLTERTRLIRTHLYQILLMIEEIYCDHPSIQPAAEGFLRFISEGRALNASKSELMRNIGLEQEVDTYITTACDLTPVEICLLRTHLQLTTLLSQFLFELTSQSEFLSKIDMKYLFEENQQRSWQMSSRLTSQLERWRFKLVEDLEKIDVLEQGQPFYSRLVAFLFELENEAEALVASEKSRARAISDLLTARSSEAADSNAQSQLSVAASPSLEDILQVAKRQRACIVEYFIQKDGIQEVSLCVWVISPVGEIHAERISLEASVSRLVESMRSSVTTGSSDLHSLGEDASTSSSACAALLYSLLIEPIHHWLPTRANTPIIFIPHDSLFLLPFGALPDSSGCCLCEKYAVSILPAIQVMQWLRPFEPLDRDSSGSSSAVVVGDPAMTSPFQALERKFDLSPLSAAKIESQAVAALLKTEAITGAQATKSEVVKRMSSASIVHLATHSLLDEAELLESPGAIALASSDSFCNSFLTTDEILELSLKANLVVLSACQTGQGRITGDGVIGLSRSLLAAGAACLVVSLWKVDDFATAFLMIRFYQVLPNEASPAAALSAAQLWLSKITKRELESWMVESSISLPPTLKLSLRRSLDMYDYSEAIYKNPRYWAAFQVIGKP
ncbi:MAG: CHAT domain-containing protein [Cyanobacteria bacterium J06650_10]